MSIINEALKKAETESRMEQDTTAGPAVHVPSPVLQLQKAVRENRYGKYLKKYRPVLLTAAFLAAAAVAMSIAAPRNMPVPVPPASSSAPVPAASLGKVHKAARAGIEPAQIEPPALVLNGILHDDAKPYAIVNGRIVVKGDTIEGAEITEINKDAVKFLFQGKDFELRNK